MAPATRSISGDVGRLEPRSQRGAKTRAAIIAAAREVFARDGFLTARTTDITEHAGVASGSFYTYFVDKDDVLAAVLETAQTEMLHPHIAEQSIVESPVEMIRAANRAYLESYQRNADLMKVLYEAAAVNVRFRDVLARRGEAFYRRNARSISRLVADGVAHTELDSYYASRALSAMVSRVAYTMFVLEQDASIEEMVRTLTDLWVNGLRIDSSV